MPSAERDVLLAPLPFGRLTTSSRLISPKGTPIVAERSLSPALVLHQVGEKPPGLGDPPEADKCKYVGCQVVERGRVFCSRREGRAKITV